MRSSNNVLLILASIALGIGLLLLTGFILGALIEDPVWAIVTGLLIVFALTVMATKGRVGRYEIPRLSQYLITFVILFVPIFGVLYVYYFVGRFLTNNKTTVYIALGGLVVALLGVSYQYLSMNDSLWFVSVPREVRTPAAPSASPTKAGRSSPTFTPEPSPTKKVVIEPSATPVPQILDCTLWSDVTSEDIGRKLCVYGEVSQGSISKDGKKIILDFGGLFQIWSLDKWMEVDDYIGQCIMVNRTVDSTSSNRPIIIVRGNHEIDACP